MKRVCGLDVHKDSVFACILDENGVIFQGISPDTSTLSRRAEMWRKLYLLELIAETLKF